MARALLGFFLPSSLFSNSTSTADADFFDEPSTMRPRLTAAAAAQKDDGGTHGQESNETNTAFYDITARGSRAVHQAAAVA